MIGKLNISDLEDIIMNNISKKREDVLLSAGVGEDCAVVDLKSNALVITTDPITATSNNIGSLVIDINMNDIASMAAQPIGIMLTILAPKNSTLEDIENVMKEAGQKASELGIEILGGHTEFTDAVNRMVVSAVGIGSVSKNKILKKSNISIGDDIVMTKGVGIEGVGILASDNYDFLKDKLTKEELDYSLNLLNMTSVIKEGKIAGEVGVVAMHDVTEGGILGAIWEVLDSGKLGCNIYEEKIIVNPTIKKVCKIYNIDPLKLISSGCMLIIVSPDKSELLVEELNKNNIEASIIGKVKENDRLLIDNSGKKQKIYEPSSDEIYKV